MKNVIQEQILEAAATLLCGLGLGLIYEAFGELRNCCSRICGALLDVLFCMMFAAALFLLGMGPGHGRLRLYMPLLALLGVWIWSVLFGRATRAICGKIRAIVRRGWQLLLWPMKKCLYFLKIFEKIFKNIFSSVKKWFTIIHNLVTSFQRRTRRKHSSESGDVSDEAEAFQHIYEDCDSGYDRVRRH